MRPAVLLVQELAAVPWLLPVRQHLEQQTALEPACAVLALLV